MADERFDTFAWIRAVLAPECTLDALERLVILTLAARFANEQGQAWPGFGSLCAVTDISRTKVVNSLAELEARGLFTRRPQTRGKGHGSNFYQLPLTPPTSALHALVGTRTSAPEALGSAPHAPPVVRQADGGSAPGAPYLPNELPKVTTQEPPTVGSAQGTPDWDERETSCPMNLVEKMKAAGAHVELAEWLKVDVESVVHELLAFQTYWVIGNGTGQRRRHWARKARQWVVDQAGQNKLTPVGAIAHARVTDSDSARIDAAIAAARAEAQ